MRLPPVLVGSIVAGLALQLASACSQPSPYPPPATPADPSEPPSIELSKLTLRAGSTMVVASEEVRREMRTFGRERIVAYLKVCFESDGAVRSLRFYKLSGVEAYDRQVSNEVRKRWRFAPVSINGRPAPACTHAAFDFHSP